MTIAQARLRAGIAVPMIFVLAAVAAFVALGTWQIERKAWKAAGWE
jgi:cytochrome oxidase assembly protein ShyY1